jgi:hypothetical protein
VGLDPDQQLLLHRLARALLERREAERALIAAAEHAAEGDAATLLALQRCEVFERRARLHVEIARTMLARRRAAFLDDQRRVPAAFRRIPPRRPEEPPEPAVESVAAVEPVESVEPAAAVEAAAAAESAQPLKPVPAAEAVPAAEPEPVGETAPAVPAVEVLGTRADPPPPVPTRIPITLPPHIAPEPRDRAAS